MITPYFAPSTAVGAKRFTFLSQRFEKLGYKVDIVTIRWRKHEPTDETLPIAGRVHRVGCIIPHKLDGDNLRARIYNWFVTRVIGIPDNFVGWLPSIISKGRQIARNIKPDVIIATGPPFTAFLTGAYLSKKTGAPLILDYRDPWSSFDWSDSPGGRRMKRPVNRALERWAVGRASALVFTSNVMLRHFEAKYVGKQPPVLRVITNGFNESRNLKKAPLTPNSINILYAGSFYGQRALHVLVDGLEELKSNPDFSNLDFAVHVFGSLRAEDRRRISETRLSQTVHEHAPVTHNKILAFMKGADILYLHSGSDVNYALPFKIFDYLSVRRPILAITPPESAVADLVEEFDCGEVANGTSTSIAGAIERILERKENYGFSGRRNVTWKGIAGQYSDLIGEIVAKSNRQARRRQDER